MQNGGGVHGNDVDNAAFGAVYTSYVGGTETRPRNVAALVLIKY
jgi:hypothetical protein